MTTFALDTNIVSYFLKNDAAVVQRINKEKDRQSKIVIPPTVYFEIQYWLKKTNRKLKGQVLWICIRKKE
jgi:predicted nucleic acid-binding protein